MYDEKDLTEIRGQIRWFWILYIIVLAIFVAGIVTCCVVRLLWPGFILMPLTALAGFAGWDLWGRRLLAYERYLESDRETLSRVFEGRVMEIPDETKTFQGVLFRPVEIRIHDEDTGDPIDTFLYYDQEKLPIPFEVGYRIRVRSVDHCIREIEWME